MSNEAARHELDEVLSAVREQMRELSAAQQKRAALTAKAFAADETVAVSVDAHSVVTEVVIDEAYLADFELADLGGHVTTAARAAAEEIKRRSAQLMAPLAERRKAMPGLAEPFQEMPDVQQLLSSFNFAMPDLGTGARAAGGGDGDQHDGSDGGRYPVVRR